MRQFVVLGYSSNSKDEPGEVVKLTKDRGEALAEVKTPASGLVRKSMFELAIPMKATFFGEAVKPVAKKKKAKADAAA